MRRHSFARSLSSVVALGWVSAAGWLGCNAILGNESAVFSADASVIETDAPVTPTPDASTPTDGATPDATSPDAGPCIDTDRNPRHCGACNHDCLAGECAAGRCLPFVVALEPGTPVALAVDDTHAYWTNRSTGDLRRAPLSGGAAETFYDGSPADITGEGVVLTGPHVYFSVGAEDGGVYRCPKDGCGAGGPELVVGQLTAPGYIGLADGGVLLIAESIIGGRVARCTLPCSGALDVIASNEGLPKFVDSDGDDIVWSSLSPLPGVVRARIGGGGPISTVEGINAYEQVLVSGPNIVFAARGTGPKVAPRDGGPSRRIFSVSTDTLRLALDGNDVIFNQEVANGNIYRCPIAGCGDAGIVVASGQARPHALVVRDKAIYWTNLGDDDTGTVMGIAK